MVKLKKKIGAFTVLESMVALVIVMIVFSLSSVVVVNITGLGMSREKQLAHMYIKTVRNATIAHHRFIDEQIQMEELLVEKTISYYGKTDELKLLTIKALKGKEEVLEFRELVIINEAL